MAQRRSRSCAAPRPLRRHGRRSDASAQPQQQQQQHYYELPIPLVSHPRSKFRGAFTKPSASVDSAQSGSHGGGRGAHKESQPISEIAPPYTSAFHPSTRPRSDHPSAASSAHQRPGSLQVWTRAQRARVEFLLRHWLLCHQPGFILVRAVWIHRIAHCALPHSTPSTPTPTTGPRAVSSAIPQVRVALSSREKFKS